MRTAAAEALGKFGSAEDLNQALRILLELATSSKSSLFVSMAALNAIDELDTKAASALAAIRELRRSDLTAGSRTGDYIPNLVARILVDIQR